MGQNIKTEQAIQNWIDEGEIPPFELPQGKTLMGNGDCNGDCHACPDVNQCALEFPLHEVVELV